MRDDILGLSQMRMFPEGWLSRQRPTRAPGADGMSNFETALTRANMARETLNAQRRYVSPLKANSLNHQLHAPSSLHKLTLPKMTAPSQTLAPHLPTRPTPPAPPAPVQRPEAPRPVSSMPPSTPMALGDYPHPNGDNGRGLHWVPTTNQSNAVVDRFVAEAQRMGVKWVTFLNDGASVGQNDYLVSKLVGAGIEPIMRLWSATLEPLKGDVEGMARHYVGMGVHYFQPYNEPNLNDEQPDGVASVDRYLDNWIPTAQAIIRGGGLPGFGSLAPGGDKDDVAFLHEALAGLRARGQLGLLDKGWLSMHNYTHNHPIEEPYTDGFFKFREYHRILTDALGRDLPIIGTEGGTFIGEQEDTAMPAIDATTAVNMATQAYTYMRDKREPWNFAYSFWTIANEAAGGTDYHFREQALFKADGSASPIVRALQALG
jgi:hypothetical protein